jgi:hypothetical protein
MPTNRQEPDRHAVIPAESLALVAWMIDVIALVMPHHAPGSPFYRKLPHLAPECNGDGKCYRDSLIALYAPVRPLSPPCWRGGAPCRIICPWAARGAEAGPGAA